MTGFRPSLLPLTAAATLLTAVSACGPIVQVGGKTTPIEAVYTLSVPAPATETPAATAAQTVDLAKALTIDTPTVPGILQTVRVPVLTSTTAVQYLTRAQWAEAPNRLFQRLLADTISSRGLAVIDQRSAGHAAPNRLSGQLQLLSLDQRNGGQVIARYDATLFTSEGIRQKQFESALPVSSDNPAVVMSGLNRVANMLAGDVADWVSKAP